MVVVGRIGVALGITLAVVAVGLASPTSAAPSGPAAQLFQLVNAERTSYGLEPLAWRDDVATIAVVWSGRMALTNELAHNDFYFSDATGTALGAEERGENVATAASIEAAHRALMDSPPHRANVLNPAFTEAGFGVAQDLAGRWWITQDFLRPTAADTAAPAPPPGADIGPDIGDPLGVERAMALGDPAPTAPELTSRPASTTTNAAPSSVETTRTPRRPFAPSLADSRISREPFIAIAAGLLFLIAMGHLRAHSYRRAGTHQSSALA